MSGRTIFEGIWRDVEGDLSKLTHHRRYHHHDAPASPDATEAPDMSFADIENEIKTLADHAKRIEHEILPAAGKGLRELEGLAGNPVVLSLLSAVHVPTEALTMAVTVIDKLEELYKPETAAQSPVDTSAPAAAAEVPVAAPAT